MSEPSELADYQKQAAAVALSCNWDDGFDGKYFYIDDPEEGDDGNGPLVIFNGLQCKYCKPGPEPKWISGTFTDALQLAIRVQLERLAGRIEHLRVEANRMYGEWQVVSNDLYAMRCKWWCQTQIAAAKEPTQ